MDLWCWKRPLYQLSHNHCLKLLLDKIPFFILSLAFGIVGIFFLQKGGSLEVNAKFSLIERLFFGQYALSNYILKFFIPINLSVFYPYPIAPGKALPFMYYLSPFFLIGIAFLVFKYRKNKRNN